MRLSVNRTQRLAVTAFALVALVVGVVALNLTGRDTLTGNESDLPSNELLAFDGTTTDLATFEGQPLVLNFWASWCPACVNELPEFQAVHERLGDEINVVGVANADVRSASDALAEQVGLTYVLLDDPDGELFRELGLIAMPSTVFIDADGEIAEVFAGQLTESALTERIEVLRSSS